MRTKDVFGRKISQSRPFYFILLIFAIVLPLHYGLLYLQQVQMDGLKVQETALQAQIDALLASDGTSAYHEIDDIIPYLPTTYEQILVANDLELVRNLAGLQLAGDYGILFTENIDSPFEDQVAATVKAVRVVVTMTVDDPDLILDYLNLLMDQDRIYYVSQLNAAFLEGGTVQVTVTIFTFYNDIVLS
jgi:hypothetical protein